MANKVQTAQTPVAADAKAAPDLTKLTNEELAKLVQQAENMCIGGTAAARAGATARSHVTNGAGAIFDFFKGLAVGIKTPEQERKELLERLAQVQR